MIDVVLPLSIKFYASWVPFLLNFNVPPLVVFCRHCRKRVKSYGTQNGSFSVQAIREAML